MNTILLHNIGRKKGSFNRSLTWNYWKNRLASFAKGHLESIKIRLVKKLVFKLEEMTVLLKDAYKESANIDPAEAKEVHPQLKEIQEAIVEQKNSFASIDYADSEEVRIKFQKLVRLANRLESRVYNRMHDDSVPQDSSPSYLRERSSYSRTRALTREV